MVDQIRLSGNAGTQPTLDEVWRGVAARLTRPAAASVATAGLVAALASRWAGLPWVLTLAAVIVMALGCDALLQVVAAAEKGPGRRARRIASGVARTLAAVAAGAIGLIVLGMIFGDKIEVMRR